MQKHTHTRAAERLRESTTRAAQLCACGSLAQSPSQPTREPSSRARRHTRGCVGRPLSHGRNTGATKSMHTGETNFSLDSGPTALHSPAQRHRQHDVCENGLSRSALPTNPDTHTHTTAPPVLSAPRASREPPRGHTRACAHTPRACKIRVPGDDVCSSACYSPAPLHSMVTQGSASQAFQRSLCSGAAATLSCAIRGYIEVDSSLAVARHGVERRWGGARRGRARRGGSRGQSSEEEASAARPRERARGGGILFETGLGGQVDVIQGGISRRRRRERVAVVCGCACRACRAGQVASERVVRGGADELVRIAGSGHHATAHARGHVGRRVGRRRRRRGADARVGTSAVGVDRTDLSSKMIDLAPPPVLAARREGCRRRGSSGGRRGRLRGREGWRRGR